MTHERLFSLLYLLLFHHKRRVTPLVLVSKDRHSNSPLLILVAYPMVLIPVKKSGTETVESKNICGITAEAPFLSEQDRLFWPRLFGVI